MARKYFGTDGVRGSVGEHPHDRGFRAAPRERRGARARAQWRHGAHRQGHAAFGLHVRGRARSRLRRRRRRTSCSSVRCPRRASPISRASSTAISAWSSAPRTISTTTTASSSSTPKAASCPMKSKMAIEAELDRGADHAVFDASRPRHARRQIAPPLPGLLRRIAAEGHDARGHEAGRRLREWRRLQGRAAHARGSRRRDHPDRLLAERPQHQ